MCYKFVIAMNETDFYKKLNDLLQKNGIARCNGYDRFIRLSYRKYKNPQMKWPHDGTNYKPIYKLLTKIHMRGVFKDYVDFLTTKKD